jgi:hypothetical protein
MQMVISTIPYGSGYWIEKKGTELGANDRLYIGNDVLELEKRIIKEVERAKKRKTYPRLIF